MLESGVNDSKQILVERPTKEIFEEFSVKSGAYKESSLIDSLGGLSNYRPLPSEIKSKNAYTYRFVREWFSQRMRKKYDELSPEIFELKREVDIDENHFERTSGRYRHVGKMKIEIPMLVQAELSKDLGWKEEFTRRVSDGDDYARYKISLSSRMPRVPLVVRQVGREAVGYTYETYGKALANGVLSNVIEENPDYAPHPKDAKLLVLWKPKPSEIHIKARRLDNDPALVLNWDRPYLVTTWREPEEEPFMHLIAACKMPNLDKFVER